MNNNLFKLNNSGTILYKINSSNKIIDIHNNLFKLNNNSTILYKINSYNKIIDIRNNLFDIQIIISIIISSLLE